MRAVATGGMIPPAPVGVDMTPPKVRKGVRVAVFVCISRFTLGAGVGLR